MRPVKKERMAVKHWKTHRDKEIEGPLRCRPTTKNERRDVDDRKIFGETEYLWRNERDLNRTKGKQRMKDKSKKKVWQIKK